jgi:hypothetical protein
LPPTLIIPHAPTLIMPKCPHPDMKKKEIKNLLLLNRKVLPLGL